MLLRRALLSKQVTNTVTIPLTTDFTASNGAVPSVNSGCSLTSSGLYIPAGGRVEYKLSDLYPKDFSKLTLEMDLMYTKNNGTHGWFDFFDLVHGYEKRAGVNYNINPRERLILFDCLTTAAIPKYTYIHVIVEADFSQKDTAYPHGEIVGLDTTAYSPFSIVKPSAIRLGHYDTALHDGWEGYAKNVKITFD